MSDFLLIEGGHALPVRYFGPGPEVHVDPSGDPWLMHQFAEGWRRNAWTGRRVGYRTAAHGTGPMESTVTDVDVRQFNFDHGRETIDLVVSIR